MRCERHDSWVAECEFRIGSVRRGDVVASGTMVTTVSIVPGKRGGGFGKPRLIEAGGQSPHVAVGDMDGDGRLDLVTGNYDAGTVAVILAVAR